MIPSRAKLALMAHQKVSLKHDLTTPIVFDGSDPGTGKTAVRIVAYSQRRRKKQAQCLLVLAPLSLLESAWEADFKKFAPDMKVSVAYAANREAAFAAKADVYITNTDGVKWLAAQKKPFWEKFTDLAIDESTGYKHSTSQRSRAAAKIVKHFKRRACLTGTPNGNTILDVWHQIYLLDDGQRLGQNFYSFRQSVSVPEQIGRKREAVRWVDKDGAEEAVFGLISDITVRHKFEECVDIPANHRYEVDFKMPPKMRKAYDAMERDHLLPLLAAQAKARLSGKPTELTAVNAAAVATKLMQIGSGAVLDNDGKVHLIDTSRYKLTMDMAEVRKHPFVLYLWDHQCDQLVLEAKSRGMSYAVFGENDRAQEVRNYQAGMYDVFFAHPKKAAHGLTLTKGTSTIWPSPTPDLELWTQANKRQHRIGQTEKTETIVILADNVVEKRVYWDLLLGKDKRMKTFLGLIEAMTNDFKLTL